MSEPTRVICSIENAGAVIDGVRFVSVVDRKGHRVHVSETVPDEKVKRFCRMTGFRPTARDEVDHEAVESALRAVAKSQPISQHRIEDKQTIDELIAANRALASDLSRLRQENEALKASGSRTDENLDPAGELPRLREANAALTAELSGLRQQAAADEKQIKDMGDQIDKLQGQLEDQAATKQRLQELTDQNAKLQAELQAAKKTPKKGAAEPAAPGEGGGTTAALGAATP